MAKKKDAAEEPQQQPAKVQPADAPEPHEVNSALSSPRMRALLEDHRKMGARP